MNIVIIILGILITGSAIFFEFFDDKSKITDSDVNRVNALKELDRENQELYDFKDMLRKSFSDDKFLGERLITYNGEANRFTYINQMNSVHEYIYKNISNRILNDDEFISKLKQKQKELK
jgi:hypothetical protein